MSAPLRVAFSDFWEGFSPEHSVLFHALADVAPAEIVPAADAELLVFSDFGSQHVGFVGTKLHYTGENTRPPWRSADFFIGHDFVADARYLRLPYFVVEELVARMWGYAPPVVDDAGWPGREFCLFLVSHPTPERAAVFEELSRYRAVTSPGSFLRNCEVPELGDRTGNWRRKKLEYQTRFRFTVAFENSAHPGYTTEKIYDALLARSIPIYWGNSRISQDVHPDCFIDAAAFPDFASLVARVAEVDRDPALAESYLARREFLVRSVDDHAADLARFLERVIEHTRVADRGAHRRRAVDVTSRHLLGKVRRVGPGLRRRISRGAPGTS